ncbi:microfibril-associated glycoprotein 4-like [Acanthaster planci]|uniref:Microfibril-associated glycoprotein 4-like n=1 Tax=Acanthaster planci TaxID=133434 RepID=A0A8B7Y8I4_ACAPL|nr:microfibril-associated glycoprotein 4-like [Acanthaster planci]
MTSVLQFAVLALTVVGVFSTATVSDDPVLQREVEGNIAQALYQQQVIINALDDPAFSEAGCNYSTIKEIVSYELQDVKLQLGLVKESVSELAELLKNRPVSPPPPPVTPPVTPPLIPKDCSEAFAHGVNTSGVYTVQPLDDEGPIEVYCDMTTDGGGWTVFQRRQDGSVDFYRNWESYRQGFGDVDREFWLGNDNLHRLTTQAEYRLRVDLEDLDGNKRSAVYSTFRVANASDKYRLTVGGYSGTPGDSLSYHNNQVFTTKDRDNDKWSSDNCAVMRKGAWWYDGCNYSNLNGKYGSMSSDGIVWGTWKGYSYSMKRTEMKMKAKI